MDGDSIPSIILLAALLLMSAFFSATETAFSSINRIRLKNAAADGNRKAKLVLELSDNYDKILSTILIGNNVVNIASASLATVIFVKHFGDAGVTLSTLVMTVLVLIFGEISPKSLAKESPDGFAMFSAPFLHVLTILLTPLNYLFMLWKKLLSKIFKVKHDNTITEEELMTIVEEATQEGGINQQESELIRSAIEFDDLEAADILTPRINIVAIDEEKSPEEIRRIFLESGHSRLPVYKKNVDHIVGVVNIKDFFASEGQPLSEIIKPAVYIVQSIKISRLLKLLQNTKSHLAVVTDEYGGTMGIVTLEDIMEELVGEIWDEHDEVIQEIEPVGENEYLISCGANPEKIFRRFDMDVDCDASTVNGWIIDTLGRIPQVGEAFTYDRLLVTITKADARHVLEIRVAVRSDASAEVQ